MRRLLGGLFHGPLLARMDCDPLAAKKHIQELATFMRISSCTVEKFHLLAEESKPKRSRGRALLPENVSLLTYQRSVLTASKNASDAIMASVCKRHGLSRKRVLQLVRVAKVGNKLKRHRTTSSAARLKQVKKLCSKRPANARAGPLAWNAFKQQNWASTAKIGTEEYTAEAKRVSLAWRRATEAEKENCRVQGLVTKLERERASSAPLGEVDRGLAALNRKPRAQVLQDGARAALAEVKHHAYYRQAHVVAADYTGLQPALVRMKPTDEAVQERVRNLFRYDPLKKRNKAGTWKPSSCCGWITHGLCCKGPYAPAALNAAHNIHGVFLQKSTSRSHMPVLVRFAVPGNPAAVQWQLVGEDYAGEVQVACEMGFADPHDVPAAQPYCLSLCDGDGSGVTRTSPRFIKAPCEESESQSVRGAVRAPRHVWRVSN